MIKDTWKPFRVRTETHKAASVSPKIVREAHIRSSSTIPGTYLVESVSEKIQSILDAVNGHSTEHTFTYPRQILDCMETAEERRQGLGLSKFHSIGMRVKFLSGEPVSRRSLRKKIHYGYKYSRNGTAVVLVYRRSGWFVEAITSTQLYPDGGGLVDPILTMGQAKLVLEKFQSTHFRVEAGTPVALTVRHRHGMLLFC